jgi:hypothetical protein
MITKQRAVDLADIALGDKVFAPHHAYSAEVVALLDDSGEFTRWLGNGTVLRGGPDAWAFVECDPSHPDAV